jgi:conjugative relaxase-like TrwC/TraI family protein
MLTISKPLSSAQAHSYHQKEFSNSQDNYYSEGDKVHGEWHGKLAREWGLKGEVNEDHFARLADGQHPLTTAQLVQHRAAYEYTNGDGKTAHTMEHRAGWDATFSAPKSVSLTALVGGDERVRLAHRESVNVALDELEKYVQARIGGNHPAETTGKFIAAKFEHDSSRPVDGYAAPQLHTHVVIFNVTERENGETRALQPHELYRSQQYATAVYRSELALRLKTLGYEIEQVQNGAPEIKGYTQEYLDASSPRRQQIKDHLNEVGIDGAEAAEIAAHRTRDAKLDVSHQEMQQRHWQMAEQFGNQPERVVREAQERQHHAQTTTPEDPERVVDRAIRYSMDRNFERKAVADERELMRDTLKRAMGEAPLHSVQERFRKEIEHGGLLPKQIAAGREPAFTTPEMISLERDNIQMMRAGRDQYPALVSREIREETMPDHHRHLSLAQWNAIQEILTSPDQITGLEGTAGAGKTTSLAAVSDAAEREGYRVEGFAPTSRAAHQLEEAGIEAHTLQHHLARGAQSDPTVKHLYILDESSLASTRQVNQFLHGLNREDRVLFVGDVRQHEAVEAGRPYYQLQQAGMRTARLDEIIRQKDPALKEAVEQLARGAVFNAIENLQQQGRVSEVPDRHERFMQIAADFMYYYPDALAISPDNQSRRELNALIHGQMRENWRIAREEHTLRILEPRQELTGADRAWAEQYKPGDVLRYSHGSKIAGVKAGEYATVHETDGKENVLTVERKDGKLVSYDPRRLQGVSVYREAEHAFSEGDRVQFTAPSKELHVSNRELGHIARIDADGQIAIRTYSGRLVEFDIKDHPHLDYGYVVTSHSSQGQTADRVIVHVDTEKSEHLVNRRMAYVAISRGRNDAHIYTNDQGELAYHLSRDNSQPTAIGQAQARDNGDTGPSSPAHGAGQQHDSSSASHGHSAGAGSGGGAGAGQGQGAGQGE